MDLSGRVYPIQESNDLMIERKNDAIRITIDTTNGKDTTSTGVRRDADNITNHFFASIISIVVMRHDECSPIVDFGVEMNAVYHTLSYHRMIVFYIYCDVFISYI